MHDNVIRFSPLPPKTAALPSVEASSQAAAATIVHFAPARNSAIAKAAKAKDDDMREQRAARREAWTSASAETEFWDAMLNLFEKAYIAQQNGLTVDLYTKNTLELDSARRRALVRGYRAAHCTQLLTPAPDLAAVNWKRRGFCDKADRPLVEQAIADDLAWLEKYPARMRRVRRPAD